MKWSDDEVNMFAQANGAAYLNSGVVERIAQGLYATAPEHPFGNSVQSRAYLLKRPGGNFLVYSSGILQRSEAAVWALGGIRRQYLNHRDEASESCQWVWRTFGAPLVCHEAEREAVSKHCTVHSTFNREIDLHTDLRAIPTPGHCPGSTCYLWQGPGARYLFTGDTLFLNEGRLRVFVRKGTSQEMIDSLHRIADLDFDVLVPGLYLGDAAWRTIEPTAFRSEVEEVIRRLRAGEIH